MAQLIINNNLYENGNVSFSRGANEEGTGFIITGILSTHLYIDDIEIIETPRYKLSGVTVFEESFGSDDYNIHYRFVADRLDVLGVDVGNGVKMVLLSQEKEWIEEAMYKNEHPILGNIGDEYSTMYIETDIDEDEDKQKLEEGDQDE